MRKIEIKIPKFLAKIKLLRVSGPYGE